MKTQELAQPLRGIIPPLVTPLSSNDQLDELGLERLVQHVLGGGVHGLFLLGTCGEGTSLSYQLRRQLVERVTVQVERRVPVLVSITDTSYSESLAMARHAADVGADAVVLAPPYYFPLPQADLLEYVLRLNAELPLPLVLYNMPSLTKIAYEPTTVHRLMQEESIVGMKDSSGDLGYVQTLRQLTRERPDWTILVGPEHLLARAIDLGADGGVSGGANVWPQLFVQIYEAATLASDTAMTDQQEILHHLVDRADDLGQIYRLGSVSAASVVKGLKSALSILGVCSDTPAEPLSPCTSTERTRIEQILRSMGLVPTRSPNRSATGLPA